MSALAALPRGYRVRTTPLPASPPGVAGPDVLALAERLRAAVGARAVVRADGIAALRAAGAAGAVVVATGLLERDPGAALAAIAEARAAARAVVVVTPDRSLREAPEHLGPPSAAAHAVEWTLAEVETLLDGAEAGLCRGADGRLTSVAAVLCAAPVARAAAGWIRPELPSRLRGEVAPRVLPVGPGRRVRRACLISWQYFEDVFYAGIGRAVAMAAQALAATGVEVHVITVAPTAERTDLEAAGIRVHRVPDRTAHGDPLHLRALGWAAAVAERYAELDAEHGFDLVEVPDYQAEGLSLALRPDTALVVTLHGTLTVFADANSADAPAPDLQAFFGLEIAALRRADLLLAPTTLLLERTRAVAALPGVDATIPLAFDPSAFPARDAPAALPDELQVTFAGRIERRKGPDLAVRAIAAAARRGRRIRLRLVGGAYDGFLEDVVRPLAAELGVEDRIAVEPPVATDALVPLLRASDCVLLPSRLDNFHMAAVEALACGVPVITTDRNGLAQWFGAEDGLAAVPLGPDFAERAADRLLDDAWLLTAGARAAAAVRERLDPARIGPLLAEAYEAVAARVQPRGAAVAALDAARATRAVERRRDEALGGLETRRRVTLAAARELEERPDLLGAYAAVTGAEDDATLLIVSHEAPEAVGGRLVDLLADLGLDGETAPDMVLSPQVTDSGAALAPVVTAVLSEREPAPELAAVPHAGADHVACIPTLTLPTLGRPA